MDTNKFVNRHVGISAEDIPAMLETIGVKSLDELIDQTIPANIRLKEPLNLPEAMTEREFAEHIAELASKNEVFTSYIGMGWYTRFARPRSNVTYSRTRFGTPPIRRIRRKYPKDAWRRC